MPDQGNQGKYDGKCQDPDAKAAAPGRGVEPLNQGNDEYYGKDQPDAKIELEQIEDNLNTLNGGLIHGWEWGTGNREQGGIYKVLSHRSGQLNQPGDKTLQYRLVGQGFESGKSANVANVNLADAPATVFVLQEIIAKG